MNEIFLQEPTSISFRKHVEEIRSASYANHWIHRYPGKLIPHIPRYFLKKEKTNKPMIVLDPFCGSGTVLVESMISGNNAIGVDINPLACFLSRVKTTKLDTEKLKFYSHTLLEKISAQKDEPLVHDFYGINYWFSPEVKIQLGKIKNQIDTIEEPDYKDFFRLIFSSLVRKTSYADPRIPPACKSKRMRKKINNNWNPNVLRKFEESINNGLKYHSEFSSLCKDTVTSNVIFSSSENLPLSDESIDFIITSPPYVNAQKYIRSTRNEILWLGLAGENERLQEIDKALVGTERVYTKEHADFLNSRKSLENQVADNLVETIIEKNWKLGLVVLKFFSSMKIVLDEMYRVLAADSKAIIVIGNNTISGIKIPSHQILLDMAIENGFRLKEIYVDDIVSRGLMTRRNKTANIINREWVLVLKK